MRHYLTGPPEWIEGEPQAPDDRAWLIVYLDVFTLILSVFVMLLSYTTFAPDKYEQLTRAMSEVVEEKPVERIEPERETESETETETETETQTETETETGVLDSPVMEETEILEQRFRQAIADQELEQSVEVSMEPGRINLQIRDKILFALGKSNLTVNGQGVLRKLVPLLNAGPHSISVEGHTDAIPISNLQFPSNWELSAQRATTVLRYLVRAGVPAERLRAVGYADTRPVADNSTPEGRAINRRVALVVHLEEE
jgi:chemotaxis protein MotB